MNYFVLHYFVLNYITSFHIICIILCQITWHHFMSHVLFCVNYMTLFHSHMHYFMLNYMTSFHVHMHYFVLNYMTLFHVICIILCKITWHHFMSHALFCVNYMTLFHVTSLLSCVALFCVKLHDIISYHMHYFVLNYMTSFHVTCIILC